MPVWKLENGIHAGNILKAHSYLGSARVAFFMPGLEYLKKGDFVFISWNEKPVPYCIEEIRFTDEKTAIIKLADVDTEEQAAELKDRQIFLSLDSFPEVLLEEKDDAALEGYKVINAQNKAEIGEVRAIIDNGPQALLDIVSADEKEFLIPVHEDIILKISHKKKTILVNLPEGLLEI